jgi:hypothetical protein
MVSISLTHSSNKWITHETWSKTPTSGVSIALDMGFNMFTYAKNFPAAEQRHHWY